MHDRLSAARAALDAFHQQLDERQQALDEARTLLRGVDAELDTAATLVDGGC